MIKNKENLCPIGTVVTLRGWKGKAIVTGMFRRTTSGQIFDYAALHYPQGYAGRGSFLYFNQEAIEGIISEGFKDEEFNILAEHIAEVEEKVHEGEQQKKTTTADILED